MGLAGVTLRASPRIQAAPLVEGIPNLNDESTFDNLVKQDQARRSAVGAVLPDMSMGAAMGTIGRGLGRIGFGALETGLNFASGVGDAFSSPVPGLRADVLNQINAPGVGQNFATRAIGDIINATRHEISPIGRMGNLVSTVRDTVGAYGMAAGQVAGVQSNQQQLANLVQKRADAAARNAGGAYSGEIARLNAQIAEMQHKMKDDVKTLNDLIAEISPEFIKAHATADASVDPAQEAAAAVATQTQAQSDKHYQNQTAIIDEIAGAIGADPNAQAVFTERIDTLKEFVDSGLAASAEGMQSALESAANLAAATADAQSASMGGDIGIEREKRVVAYTDAIKQLVISRNAAGAAAGAAARNAHDAVMSAYGQGSPLTATQLTEMVASNYMAKVKVPERDRGALFAAMQWGTAIGGTYRETLDALASTRYDDAGVEIKDWWGSDNGQMFAAASKYRDVGEVLWKTPAISEATFGQWIDHPADSDWNAYNFLAQEWLAGNPGDYEGANYFANDPTVRAEAPTEFGSRWTSSSTPNLTSPSLTSGGPNVASLIGGLQLGRWS
jgi:hypothetical protein